MQSDDDKTRTYVPLIPGTEVGHYRIIEKIGAGGMGEVYLAEDTKLNRKVALKFLPPHLCQDDDCRKRFTREAHAAAGLDHPNIAAIYEVGEFQGRPFFAMQVIEGRSLREVIAGKDLPLENILEIAIQVCEGLQAAHDKGIIHRDIKPSNILLDSHGRVRIVDFGLASVRGSEQLTKTGSTLGTVGYMSPEQVRGQEVDHRSDLFSLGVVLYELLTKQNPFKRDTEAATLKAVVDDLPEPLARFKAGLPDRLQFVIEKALDKDVKTRYQHADGMLADLMRIRRSLESGSISGFKFSVKRQAGSRTAWIAAAFFAIVAVAIGWQQLTGENPQAQSFRFTVTRPQGVTSVEWPQLSPDGRYLAFLGFDSTGASQVWIRPLDSLQSYPLPGTTAPAQVMAARPFWSPDSKYLAVYDAIEKRFKKTPVEGGPSVTICKTLGCDGSWGSSGTIIFDDYEGSLGIGQVSSSGGEPRSAVPSNTFTEGSYVMWPSFLPDGRHFICVERVNYWGFYSDECYLKLMSLDQSESKLLGTVVGRAAYCDPGYILYLKNGFLAIRKFNTSSFEFEGDPVLLAEMPAFRGLSLGLTMNASASNNGLVAWQKGTAGLSRLVWVDRQGRDLDTVGDLYIYGEIHLSPGGRYVAYDARVSETQKFKVGVLDLERNRAFRLTSSDYDEYDPIWSPVGDTVAFTARHVETIANSSIEYCRLFDPESSAIVTSDSSHFFAMSWRRPGELWLCEYLVPPSRGKRILVVDPKNPAEVKERFVLSERENPRGISPDGRYLLSEGSKVKLKEGVYVTDLLEQGKRWQISPGGSQPRWSHDGREIFFFDGDAFKVVKIDTSNGFNFGPPEVLFSRPQYFDPSLTRWGYDVSPDGQRFLFVTPVSSPGESAGDIEVVVNWPAAYGVEE